METLESHCDDCGGKTKCYPDCHATCEKQLEELEALQSVICKLDIQVMQPSMSGDHQASVRSYTKRFTPQEWAAILNAREQVDDG